MTYFGSRTHTDDIKKSMNVSQLIKEMNLGNLSGHSKIPEIYIRSLLGYLVQISQAMRYAHQNGLVHGNYNLSKIVV